MLEHRAFARVATAEVGGGSGERQAGAAAVDADAADGFKADGDVEGAGGDDDDLAFNGGVAGARDAAEGRRIRHPAEELQHASGPQPPPGGVDGEGAIGPDGEAAVESRVRAEHGHIAAGQADVAGGALAVEAPEDRAGGAWCVGARSR